jgi:4-amino-4-deoxy-L-arabinose transferase-like glycosyltransferase
MPNVDRIVATNIDDSVEKTTGSRLTVQTVAGVFGIAAIALALRWPIADIPLERDEGEYGYIADRWLAGEPPYRSAFDQKPPGVFAAYAVILSTLGRSPATIHWAAQLYTLLTLAAICFTARRLFGATAASIAALLAAYMTASGCVLGNAANTELFMILPLTAGFLGAVNATDRVSPGWSVFAGGCGGLALLFKQVALPNVAVYGLLLLGASRQRWRLVLIYVLAGAAAPAAVVVYFTVVGLRKEFFDCVLLHNLEYANQVAWSAYPVAFLDTFGNVVVEWWPILLFAGIAFKRPASGPTRWDARWLALAWLLPSFAGVAVGGYFRPHYYVQAIPPLAVLAGRGIVVVTDRRLSTRKLVAVGLAIASIAYGVLIARDYWINGAPADKVPVLYGIAPFAEAAPVGEYLREHTGANDTIFVYGNEPEIYFYSLRRAASRYIFVYPLLTPTADVRDRQRAAFEDVAAHTPRFIVIHRDLYPPVEWTPPKEFEHALRNLLNREYRLVAAAGPFSNGVQEGSHRTQLPYERTLDIWRRIDR